MRKTLLYRLFGLGKIPKRHAPALHQEGVVLIDEGVGGAVTLKNFRAPGKRCSWKQSLFTGCLVLTRKTFAAFAFSKPLVYVPFAHDRFSDLHCRLTDENTLFITFDPSAFHENWSGTVEIRYKTAQAQLIVERLESMHCEKNCF